MATTCSVLLAGLTDKFRKNDNFKHFTETVLEHLKETGMDTISYFPDLADPCSWS
jgi:hypothetical protein